MVELELRIAEKWRQVDRLGQQAWEQAGEIMRQEAELEGGQAETEEGAVDDSQVEQAEDEWQDIIDVTCQEAGLGAEGLVLDVREARRDEAARRLYDRSGARSRRGFSLFVESARASCGATCCSASGNATPPGPAG